MKTDIEQIELLLEQFRRPTPEGKEYQDRLAEEFEIILQQRFTDYFLKIRLILDLNSDIPHMTRDSVVVGEGQMWTKDNSNYLKVKRKNVKAMPIDQYA